MDEYAKLVPCPEGCTVAYTGTNTGIQLRHGEDYDSYFFDVLDSSDAVISQHEVRDSTSVNPPSTRCIFLYR